MSCKTRLGQLQTCIDTSVTLNSITNSNRTTTRHMRAPILTCHNARVSPMGNFPCVTHDNTEHASRTEKKPANASEKSKWCHAHEMALQTYANARAYLNVNEVVPSLTQRTENHERIHMRSRSSTGHAEYYGKRLDPQYGLQGPMANGPTKRHCFRFAHTKLAHSTQNYRLITPSTMS